MIFFEIDGVEYTVNFEFHEVPGSLPFVTPEGVTYWMRTPEVAA